MRLRHPCAVAALSAAALLAGCGDDDDKQAAADVPKGCEKVVPSSPRDLPDGFPEPEAGLTAASVEQDGDQLQVKGFTASSPGDATRALLAVDGVKKIDSEDDGSDSEASFTSGDYRYAFKFVETCKGGSTFSAVRVREPGS
jgi:hypothetical protein